MKSHLALRNSAESLIPLVIADVASPHTKRVYRAELFKFLEWFAARADSLDGFSRQTVLAYRDEEMRAKGRGVVSVNLALSAIKKLARIAGDAGAMDQGQASAIDRVAGLPRSGKKRLGNWLSLEQLKTLLAYPPPTTPNRGMRDRTALWIMGTCGLRREEAANLQVRNMAHRDGRPVLLDVLGKGQKYRTVPIHTLADTAIRAWMAHASIQNPDAYILPTFSNPDTIQTKQSDGARLYDACHRYCKAFQIDFRPHDLRRTFAVLAKKGGADLEEIRVALGHSSVVTTEIYLRGPMSLENAAADRIKL